MRSRWRSGRGPLEWPSIGLLFCLSLVLGCSGETVVETTTSEGVTSTTTTTTVGQPTTTESTTMTTVDQRPFEILAFHKTAAFRHESIGAGIAALEGLGEDGGYRVAATEDASVFSTAGLERYSVIVFLNTTGDVLEEAQQKAMEGFIAAGKGYVGIHSAADTEYDWDWYGNLVGAYFDGHPEPQEAVVHFVEPDAHPVVEGLPGQVVRFDEWYDYRSQPPAVAMILATIDEASYEGGAMGASHPIVWAQEVHGGRSVYTGFGHTSESFEEPLMRRLLDNAIRWAAGAEGP